MPGYGWGMPAEAVELALSADLVGADELAARRARQLIADFLVLCGPGLAIEPRVVDDVLLAVSELVTNAVVHAREAPTVTIRLQPDRYFLVEVADRDDRPPMVVPGEASRVGGHGLRIVDAIASSWGVRSRPGGGKSVWAVFDTVTRQRPIDTAPRQRPIDPS